MRLKEPAKCTGGEGGCASAPCCCRCWLLVVVVIVIVLVVVVVIVVVYPFKELCHTILVGEAWCEHE